ncbi:MAG: D-hexose-6-phosphate mutarotase [Proteobacteria bacterium]|nr:D-hexose-6-phosphate mutarotase [Pseudomonadota bacterium]
MTKVDLPAVNQKFAIDGHLNFNNGPGGLAIAEIGNLHASANIFLQGAHLASWTPRRRQPVIWLSPLARFAEGKPIRGGVPVCWPWFASHPSEANFPFHGFARTSLWEVAETAKLDDGGTLLVLRLPPNEASLAVWPNPTPVEIRFTVGDTLGIELVTRNEGAAPVIIGQALHAYFRVGDVRQIAILGLDGHPYIDKLEEGKRKQQEGQIRIGGEVDRIYLDAGGDCQIEDPSLKRRILIGKQGSHSTIVWNPGAEKAAAIADMGEACHANMVCVETANAADDVVTIAPGAEHKLSIRYSVENL